MRTIKHCVNHRIIDLCKRAMELEMLDAKIKKFLPPELHDVCKAGNFENGCLTLITSDAAWATPLNFLKPTLRDQLRKEGFLRLGSITVKIMPLVFQETTSTIKPAKKLSFNARTTILAFAENCQIPILKKAFLKLAK